LRMENMITIRAMLLAGIVSVYFVVTCLVKILTTPMVAVSYTAAFIIFLGLFLVRERIGQNNVFAGLSAISYPLYLVHSTIGLSILQCGTVYVGLSTTAALIAAIMGSLAIACALHFTVERRSIAWGRRLAPRGPDEGG
jgi:peptidoglycan/LPS O-acetylase OafA/YrhL